MSLFDLDPDRQRRLDEDARLNPLDLTVEPIRNAWDGTGQALLGLTRPAASVLRTGAMIGALSPGVQASRFIMGQEEFDRRYYGEVVGWTQDVVDANTPDAASMGSAAKALSVVNQAAGTIPFLFASPPTFLADSAVSPATDLVDQGVDADTAAIVGGVNLAANAVGLKLPNALGSTVATRAASGAGINVTVGAATDAASGEVLERGGYADQAQGFSATDPYARGLDLLLGMAFPFAEGSRLPPAQRDAVLAARNADSFARRTLPGEAATRDADVSHVDAMSDTLRKLAAGEPVDVSGVIRAEDFRLRPEVAPVAPSAAFESAVEDVLRAEGGFVDDPVDRGGATKYGISSRVHPDVDVANLTQDEARAIYRRDYWNAIDADTLPDGLRAVAFDAAVNQGVGWTRKALQEAGGDAAEFLKLREARYREIVAADPSQQKFLRGWLNRLGRFKETSDAGRALRERVVQDPEQIAVDYAALPDSDRGRVLNTDIARELSPEYLADRTRSADVHEAASDVVKTLYESKLAQPTPEGMEPVVMFTAGGTGAGKTTAVRDAGDVLGKPEMIYDTNMNTLGSAADKVQQALDAGRSVRIAYVYRDTVEALTGGAIPRAQRQAAKFGTGRTVPINEHAKTHAGVRHVIDTLAAKYRGDPRVEIVAIDNSRGRGKSAVVPLETLPKVEEHSLRGRLEEALDQARSAGLSEDLYRGFGATDRPAAQVGAGAGRESEPPSGQVTAAATPLEAAQRAAAEFPQLQIIDGFDADGAPRYRPMSEALAEIEAERQQAAADAQAYPAAVNCFLRRGDAP